MTIKLRFNATNPLTTYSYEKEYNLTVCPASCEQKWLNLSETLNQIEFLEDNFTAAVKNVTIDLTEHQKCQFYNLTSSGELALKDIVVNDHSQLSFTLSSSSYEEFAGKTI